MKFVSVIGARPQFVKAAMVSHALRSCAGHQEVVVHTGQHYDAGMSDVFFSELEMPEPGYNLRIGSGSHGLQTGRMLEGIEEVLLRERPECVLVYGDTNSTIAGALAATKLHIPVAHVEAGLRSFNRAMPEEINRILTDHASDLLLVPTELAIRNLVSEGVSAEKISLVGDVMFDAALYFAAKAMRQSQILSRLGVEPGRYVLATVHRAENTDSPERLQAIIAGLVRASQEIPVIVPLHPRTRKILNLGVQENSGGVIFIDPVGYLDMVNLEKHAAAIATDSGGIQKEAFFFRVPCLTLRTETEWIELVDLGWNRLVTAFHAETIAAELLEAIGRKGREGSPYGSGQAAKLICEAVFSLAR